MGNEWYTPKRYIDAARAVLGEIDLDPASCSQANETVKAKKYFDLNTNGLIQQWSGRVWLNPPYGTTGVTTNRGQSNIRLFSEKLIGCYEAGEVEEAILLARSDPGAYWFAALLDFPVCFVSKDILFDGPLGRATVKHQYGSCFVYLGPQVLKFIDHFAQFGRIVRAIK